MVRKAFSGDLLHELPKGKIEPYRLWFEYLRYAIDTIPTRVNKKYYKEWGDISNCKFDDWFQDNWKRLFANPASLSLVDSLDDADRSLKEEGVILVRVRNSVPIRRQIADFTKLLSIFKGAERVTHKKQPDYVIVSKRSINYDTLRAMLKFLRLMQSYADIEVATKDYMKWAEAWNKKIKIRKNDKRTEIYIPAPISTFIEEMDLHEKEQKQLKRKLKKSPLYNNAKNAVRRFHRRAEKVVSNTARGQFPGEY